MIKALQNTILSYSDDLSACAMEVAVKFDVETIHELRTSFKKLRALLRWQKADKKIYATIKPIYAMAGEIRNIQLIKEMAKKNKAIPVAYRNWLLTALTQFKKEWNRIDISIPQRLQRELKQIRLDPGKNKTFFTSRIKKIKKIMNITPVTDDTVHDIRKMIKDMQYVREWQEKHKAYKRPITDLSLNFLKNIGKLIGEYNDRRMFLMSITLYAMQEKEAELIRRINPVIDLLQQEKMQQKEKLLALLQEAFFKSS